jgi:CRISPR-associated protein Csm1
MDDTVLKIALAGLLHDIGKLAEDGMYVSPEFLDGNAHLYQPFFNSNYTHRHAVFTAAFIDHIEKFLPSKFNKAGWGLGDPFINLAAGHHTPVTPLQWIVAMADRISSGWDRNNFESDYNQAIAWQNYRKTRLLPIFESLLKDEKERKHYAYRYLLKELNPQNIFPLPYKEAVPENDEVARKEYKKLFDDLIFALEKLRHKDLNLELWLEHLDSLLLIFTSMIPAARAGKVTPDVSLYDHCRSVSALSSALYLYHRDTGSLTTTEIRDYDQKKFLLIGADFYGIQDFIFSDSGEAGKSRAKILRGRSFAVSLYCELAADMLCRRIGLPSTSLLLNAAGKFTIISPNTQQAKEAILEVESKINSWLMSISFGENAIGISTVDASPDDFVPHRFLPLWESLTKRMAERKFHKFSLDEFGGAVSGYLDEFQNDLNPPLCPYCGKRPSSPEAEGYGDKDNDKSMCRICRDHIFLGTNLVRKIRIAVTSKEADIYDADDKLLAPIFDEYQVAFTSGVLNRLAASGDLYKYWDIAIDESGELSKEVTARFLAGYVPLFREEDRYYDRILRGKKSEKKKEQLIEDIRDRNPKSFEHIAATAMNIKTSTDGVEYCGIQAMGILKADVDQLGLLMACGLGENEFTISRLATLSRQLHFFFAVFLPHLLKTKHQFQDVYTVFAGGDDLFLIGPWNRMIDLAAWLRSRFADYTCHNDQIHFSAGISIQKPNIPLNKLAKDAEDALEKAKAGNPEKAERGNCINVFGETATWDEFLELRRIGNRLRNWREKELINNAMIYRLNAFIGLANMEKEILKEESIRLEDMEYLKWPAYFRYSTERNIGRQLKDEIEKRKAKDEFGVAAKWLKEYGSLLKIALWDVIYNNR